MNIKVFFTLFLALCLTACGTLQLGIDWVPEDATSIPSTVPPVASPTPQILPPTETATPLPPAATLPAQPTRTPIPPSPTPTSLTVQIFLVAVGDNGVSGQLIGCGDSLVPVQVEIPYSQAVLKASLEKLLSLKTQFYGESGLYNALYQSDLQLGSVTLVDGKAVINLTGSMQLGGECDDPRVAAQLDATARQFPSVHAVEIYVNGRLLSDVLSLKG
jgi:hypothetical protein